MRRSNFGSKILQNKHTLAQQQHLQNPTKQLAGDLMLVDVFLRQPGHDGKCGVIVDFSIITPAVESYCAEAAKKPHVRFQNDGKREGY